MSHSCLLINIDMWGRIVLICSNFNLKQVCGGGCSFSSPQMFWLVQLSAKSGYELSWPNWQRLVLKTNIKKKKQKKLSCERNLVNCSWSLLWEKFDKAAYSLCALLCKASIFIVLSQENMKGSTETWIEVTSKDI